MGELSSPIGNHRSIAIEVRNATRRTKFFNVDSARTLDGGLRFMRADLVRSASLAAHEHNSKSFAQNPDAYREVVPSIFPIPPRTIWSFQAGQFSPLAVRPPPKILDATLDDLIRAAKRYLRKIKESDLSVELSGGLDTSLIIAITRLAGTNPSLIGVISQRYEFRTERVVQKHICTDAKISADIEEDDALPFSRMLEVPSHTLPNKASLFFSRHRSVANAAVSLGANIVLNGIGLEPLLCEPIRRDASSMPFQKWMWDDNWANEYIYLPRGCAYVNAAIHYPFPQLLWVLRRGQDEDPMKHWARGYFSKILPVELTRFSYKAAFDGVYESALKAAVDDIRELGRVAYEVTGVDELRSDRLLDFANRSVYLDHTEDVKMMARLSYAVWVYGLVRDGII